MTGVGFHVSVVAWRPESFRVGFHVIVVYVVDVVVVYTAEVAVAAVVTSSLALPKRPLVASSSSLPFLWGRWFSFGCGLFFPVVAVPASFDVVSPKILPFSSFPRSPGEKGDGSLGGPLASAKGLRAPPPIGGPSSTLCLGPCWAGSLTAAVRLSNGNACVPGLAQRGRKPRVEQKGKSSLDLDFLNEYGPQKRGPSILSERRAPFRREVSEKLPQR